MREIKSSAGGDRLNVRSRDIRAHVSLIPGSEAIIRTQHVRQNGDKWRQHAMTIVSDHSRGHEPEL